MKFAWLIIITVIFFLLVNSTFYWEGKLGDYAMAAFILMVLFFCILVFCLFRQVYLAIKEKSISKIRLITIGILGSVLSATIFFPQGLYNFEKLEGSVILLAQREGVANCMTTLKLRSTNRFAEKSVCFGVTEVNGNYKMEGDTIYFENVYPDRDKEGYFSYALIRPSANMSGNEGEVIILYKDLGDTVGQTLFIIKNEMKYPPNKQALLK